MHPKSRIDAIRVAAGREISAAEIRQAATVTPNYTPQTVRPRIRNMCEMQASIEREFPTQFRGAGIAGQPPLMAMTTPFRGPQHSSALPLR